MKETLDMPSVTASLSALGITYHQTVSPVPHEDKRIATEASEQSFESLLDWLAPANVMAVDFTDADYGTEEEDGYAVDPKYTDQPAIMVVYEGADIPYMGPFGHSVPDETDAIFVAFVDGRSQQVIEAVSFPARGVE